MVFDCLLLAIPTLVISFAAANLSLSITDPEAYNAMTTYMSGAVQDEAAKLKTLSDFAPLLVKIDAEGLPASVKLAVEESDLQLAGKLLEPYEIDLSLSIGTDPPPLAPGKIRVEILELIPYAIRGMAVFGTAALYFTLLTAGRRRKTIGKRLFGIRVVRLDGRPLTYWESFERFGGYLASIGTFGAGLYDIWRDPNRRLAHDRIVNTVVIRTRGA